MLLGSALHCCPCQRWQPHRVALRRSAAAKPAATQDRNWRRIFGWLCEVAGLAHLALSFLKIGEFLVVQMLQQRSTPRKKISAESPPEAGNKYSEDKLQTATQRQQHGVVFHQLHHGFH